MTTRPISDITKAKIKYSTYTMKELKNLPLAPCKLNPQTLCLRRIAYDVGISLNSFKKIRKDELITIILKECEPFKYHWVLRVLEG